MKEMLEQICTKKLVFASLEAIDPKLLHTRKKLQIFSGTDLNSFYHIIFRFEQKSRFVASHYNDLMALYQKVEQLKHHSYKTKHLILKTEICSKIKCELNSQGWKIYHDFM